MKAYGVERTVVLVAVSASLHLEGACTRPGVGVGGLASPASLRLPLSAVDVGAVVDVHYKDNAGRPIDLVDDAVVPSTG